MAQNTIDAQILMGSKNSLLGPLTDYISTPNLFDMFNFFEDNKSKSFPLHASLNTKCNSLGVDELLLLSSNPTVAKPFNMGASTFFLDTELVLPVQFGSIFQPFSNDIQKYAITNNNMEELNDIFPEKSIQFEYFEFSGSESDMSTYEALSTPETKIFYPEPFIASPSFVHEDLWFMHILHFQHWL